MKNVKVRITAECDQCGGVGRVAHPEWLAYWTQFGEQVGGKADLAAVTKWFACRGIIKLPTEEIECSGCSGRGRVEKQISLLEFDELRAAAFPGRG